MAVLCDLSALSGLSCSPLQAVLGRFVDHLRVRMNGVEVFQENPTAFLARCRQACSLPDLPL